MSHFTNLQTILSADQEDIRYLILHEDADELADDFVCAILAFQGLLSDHELRRIKEQVMNSVTDYEIEKIQNDPELLSQGRSYDEEDPKI